METLLCPEQGLLHRLCPELLGWQWVLMPWQAGDIRTELMLLWDLGGGFWESFKTGSLESPGSSNSCLKMMGSPQGAQEGAEVGGCLKPSPASPCPCLQNAQRGQGSACIMGISSSGSRVEGLVHWGALAGAQQGQEAHWDCPGSSHLL